MAGRQQDPPWQERSIDRSDIRRQKSSYRQQDPCIHERQDNVGENQECLTKNRADWGWQAGLVTGVMSDREELPNS